MAQGGFRVLALAGVLAVGGAALAGCGGGSSGRRSAASASSPTTATTAPATTVAPSPTTTPPAPATTVPATTVPPATAPATSPSSSSSSGGGPVLIVQAFGGSVGYDGQKPSVIDFSSDSTNIVTHLTWSTWGPSTAIGNGQLGLNNCQPNCAQGTVTQVPVTIDLSAVVSGHFTAMTEKATSLFRTYSYPSNWALGAS